LRKQLRTFILQAASKYPEYGVEQLPRNSNERLLGFDNAHRVREGRGPGAKTRIKYDHKHQGERVRFYDYQDAMSLLTDFWNEVEQILKDRGKAK
jgi:hypothetical protein